MSLRRVQIGYALAVTVLVMAYYAWPFARPATTGTIAALGVAAIAFGVLRLRPPRWGAWLLIATAVLLLGIGDVVFTTLADAGPGPVRYPGPPDVFYLAAYVPLALGLLFLGRPSLPSRDWPMLLDTIGLTLAGALLVWVILARPTVLDLNLNSTEKIIAIASWVGYMAVLAASARVVLAWRTNLSLGLLGAGVLAFLIADFFYGGQVISGTWSTGSLIDLGFLAFSLLSGAAALTRSMRQVASAGHARHQLGPVRLSMLALALLVAPTILLVQATAGPVTSGVAIGVVSAAVGVLMLVRLSLSARAYRRRAERERAIRVASRDLVRATSDAEVIAAVDTAFRAITREPESASVSLEAVEIGRVQPGVTPVYPGSANGTYSAALPNREGGAAGPIRSRLVFTAALADLVELAAVLQGLANQAGLALQRIGLSSRLQDEERERYFRTLVLTSEDVTLINRNGRIDYATPSATTLFGRDVLGQSIDDVLYASAPAPPPDEQQGQPFEVTIERPNGQTVTARARRRDLTADPTVGGVVTTLRDVTAERELQRDLAYRATHDPLTGLVNAQAFASQLRPPEAERRAGKAAGRAALFIDLDDFKAVNDTFGHLIGDRLLTEVANRIRSCLRAEDLAARLGGDEFAVILRDLSGAEAAYAIAQRLTDTLAVPAKIDDVTLDCRASIGLAYTDRPEQTNTLLRDADAALYAAKAHGKGHWRQYRPGMQTPALAQLANRRRIQEAIDSEQLILQYQPIVALASGQAVGFEALVRFPDADPPMPPQEIITTAEETGLIVDLGDWILQQAAADLARINPPGRSPRRYISVNISARQLHLPDFSARVRAHLAEAGADPRLLVLELTERLPADTDERAWQELDELRGDGARVALDHYGTGSAALSYLRRRDIDLLKIDRSFLTGGSDDRGRSLCAAIVNLCRELDLQPIAEGVTNHDTEQFLLGIGCQYGQGFLYAPAMPLDEAERWTPGR